MTEKLKKHFEVFKNLYGKNNKETNLKILKLGIEIGKESNNNNEKFLIEEIEKEIEEEQEVHMKNAEQQGMQQGMVQTSANNFMQQNSVQPPDGTDQQK